MKKIIGIVALATGLFGAVACTAEPVAEEVEPFVETMDETESQPPESETDSGPAVVTNDSDGVFTYSVSELGNQDTFFDSWGDPFYPDQSTFYVVDVTATNDSNAPATAPDPWMLDHVVAVDSEGRSHAADDEPWTDNLDLNPGASITYSVAWDLPEGVEVEYVELSSNEAYAIAVLEVD